MSKGRGLLLSVLVSLATGLMLTACQNDSDYTAPAPTIPENAAVLNLAKNATAVSGYGYVTFSHLTHNARPVISNDCMQCHIHTAVTVSPTWPCARCHGPGGSAAGLEVCSNPEVPDHGQSCITRACFDCHLDPLRVPQAANAYGLTPTDCRFCHAYEAVFADSAVEGLQYNTPTWSSKSDAGGIFEYHNGETLTFSAGGVVLGSLSVDGNLNLQNLGYITPVDLVPGAVDETNQTVTNLARFLLTVDSDFDPLTGIKLPSNLASVVNGRSIDFTAATAAFELNPVIADIQLNYRPLVSVAYAQTHLHDTILNGPFFN